MEINFLSFYVCYIYDRTQGIQNQMSNNSKYTLPNHHNNLSNIHGN